MYISRRRFVGGSAVALGSLAATTVALADGPTMVSETEPMAQALGYKADASTVDKSKYSQYASGQSCSNCQLYQGKAGDASGPCPLYAGKSVSAKGWCGSYAKKS
jgi:hypothetical protein